MNATKINPGTSAGKKLDAIIPQEPGTVKGTLRAFQTIVDAMPARAFDQSAPSRRGPDPQNLARP